MLKSKKLPWYAGGLHFECIQCGRCCSGPGAGYIWVTRPEIELISDFLKIPIGQMRKNYLKRVGLRTSIIEQAVTRDCAFLQEVNRERRCSIYPIRPSQCRLWPFWPENLKNLKVWNKAAQRCPGINRGKLYTFDEIQRIKKNRKWWQDAKQTVNS